MKLKFYFLFLFLIAFLFMEMNLYSQDKYILWLRDWYGDFGDENLDQGFIDLLTTEGYQVEVKTMTYREILSPEELDSAQNAALIIWSKSCYSVGYASGENPELIAQWNNMPVPLISLSPWLLRNTRAKWFNSSTCGKGYTGTLTIAAAHAIFGTYTSGMTLPAYNPGVINTREDNILGADYMDLTGTNAGNATVLATTDTPDGVLIAEFDAGTEFYTGSGQTPAHKRMFFSAGVPGDNYMGAYNLMAGTSEDWFKTAVAEYYAIGNVGIMQPKNQPDLLSVFPNPAKDVLKLTLRSGVARETEISICDITGKTVYRRLLSISGGENHLGIDISNLARGIYLLQTDLDNNHLVRKVILE